MKILGKWNDKRRQTMSATNRGSIRKPHDFYPTPIPTIETFLDVFPLRGGSRCWNREQVAAT